MRMMGDDSKTRHKIKRQRGLNPAMQCGNDEAIKKGEWWLYEKKILYV